MTKAAAIRGALSEDAVMLRKELQTAFNERFVDELLETVKVRLLSLLYSFLMNLELPKSV